MCNILLQVFGLGKDEQNSPEIQFASVAQRDTEEKVNVTQTLVRGKPLKHSVSTYERKPLSSDAKSCLFSFPPSPSRINARWCHALGGKDWKFFWTIGYFCINIISQGLPLAPESSNRVWVGWKIDRITTVKAINWGIDKTFGKTVTTAWLNIWGLYQK